MKLSVQQKLWLLLATALMSLFLSAVWAMWLLQTSIQNERRNELQYIMQVVKQVIDAHVKQVQQGQLTREQTQKEVVEFLRAVRHGNNQYIFIYTLDRVGVLTPNDPNLEGKDASHIRDANGQSVVAELVNIVQREGSGFHFYDWPRVDGQGNAPKLSYVVRIPEWNWLVGTGVYVEDVTHLGDYLMTHGLGLIGVVVLLSLVLTGVVLVILTEMKGGLSQVLTAIHRMGDGDYSQPLKHQRPDEFGAMLDALQQMQSRVVDAMGQIRQGATAVMQDAAEIAAGNQQVSQRTESQASNLEETAASMEQMTSTVKQNAENAQRANTLSEQAQQLAEQGGSVVTEAVNAMNAINDASRKIADIIGVIDEIAFQTNLLALNAAVEAARAGEQGRGFAVVAAEVRNLAQRSATAAKEIKELIQDSVNKVDDGTRLVDAVGKNLRGLFDSVHQVSTFVAEIAAASREQSAGIEQVNQAVIQMEEITQRNAALVQETAAASQALDDQAKRLMEQVQFFRTGNEGMAIVAVANRPKAKPKVDSFKPRKPAPKFTPSKSLPPPRSTAMAAPKPMAAPPKPLSAPAASPASEPKPALKAITNPNPPPAKPTVNNDDWEEF